VYGICQTVTVYRDARHVLTAPVAQLSREALVEAMTGEATGLRAIGADRSPVTPDADTVLAWTGWASTLSTVECPSRPGR